MSFIHFERGKKREEEREKKRERAGAGDENVIIDFSQQQQLFNQIYVYTIEPIVGGLNANGKFERMIIMV